jgi:Integrase zinc binding domain/RNase H-like domain found in reverse transcriptase
MEHWRHFLEGARHQVTVLSDHNNLRWFNTTTKLSRRQVGLWLKLSKFDYVIKHRPGSSNPADMLSRRSDYRHEEPLPEIPFLNLSAITVPETIRSRYEDSLANDEYAQEIMSAEELPEGWSLEEGILCFDEKAYVPAELRLRVMEICHDNPLAGHFGQKRTLDLVQRQYHWPGLSTFVKQYVTGCHSCRRNKSSTHKAYGLLAPHPLPEAPWTRVGLDFVTGLPKTRLVHDAILVMVDAYIKRAHFEPVKFKDCGAKKTATIIR